MGWFKSDLSEHEQTVFYDAKLSPEGQFRNRQNQKKGQSYFWFWTLFSALSGLLVADGYKYLPKQQLLQKEDKKHPKLIKQQRRVFLGWFMCSFGYLAFYKAIQFNTTNYYIMLKDKRNVDVDYYQEHKDVFDRMHLNKNKQ